MYTGFFLWGLEGRTFFPPAPGRVLCWAAPISFWEDSGLCWVDVPDGDRSLLRPTGPLAASTLAPWELPAEHPGISCDHRQAPPPSRSWGRSAPSPRLGPASWPGCPRARGFPGRGREDEDTDREGTE